MQQAQAQAQAQAQQAPVTDVTDVFWRFVYALSSAETTDDVQACDAYAAMCKAAQAGGQLALRPPWDDDVWPAVHGQGCLTTSTGRARPAVFDDVDRLFEGAATMVPPGGPAACQLRVCMSRMRSAVDAAELDVGRRCVVRDDDCERV
jgi:hypothetical protein